MRLITASLLLFLLGISLQVKALTWNDGNGGTFQPLYQSQVLIQWNSTQNNSPSQVTNKTIRINVSHSVFNESSNLDFSDIRVKVTNNSGEYEVQYNLTNATKSWKYLNGTQTTDNNINFIGNGQTSGIYFVANTTFTATTLQLYITERTSGSKFINVSIRPAINRTHWNITGPPLGRISNKWQLNASAGYYVNISNFTASLVSGTAYYILFDDNTTNGQFYRIGETITGTNAFIRCNQAVPTTSHNCTDMSSTGTSVIGLAYALYGYNESQKPYVQMNVNSDSDNEFNDAEDYYFVWGNNTNGKTTANASMSIDYTNAPLNWTFNQTTPYAPFTPPPQNPTEVFQNVTAALLFTDNGLLYWSDNSQLTLKRT